MEHVAIPATKICLQLNSASGRRADLPQSSHRGRSQPTKAPWVCSATSLLRAPTLDGMVGRERPGWMNILGQTKKTKATTMMALKEATMTQTNPQIWRLEYS